jgi:GTP-binding protein Era
MNPNAPDFRAGFVCIMGKPNAGKSTLLNALLDYKLAIVTPKAQTTRHRIAGVLTEEHFQMVFVDTPGVTLPNDPLREALLRAVKAALREADALLLLAAPDERFSEDLLAELAASFSGPVVLAVNKTDLTTPDHYAERVGQWRERLPGLRHAVGISALLRSGFDDLKAALLDCLPPGPPFYDPDELTDRPERFFVAELIREQLFLHLEDELPYQTEVQIVLYDEAAQPLRIEADIHVARRSQKMIVIGQGGGMLRRVGTAARREIEKLLERPVFLGLHVRHTPDWDQQATRLRRFGYE